VLLFTIYVKKHVLSSAIVSFRRCNLIFDLTINEKYIDVLELTSYIPSTLDSVDDLIGRWLNELRLSTINTPGRLFASQNSLCNKLLSRGRILIGFNPGIRRN
jgi:hypothetical protein